jgi:hypothetical protein
MDSQFLEFWGNYLLAAARGQKQMENLNQWISQGFSGFEELTAMFQKYYGLERPRNGDSDSTKMWQDAAAGFRNSLNDYLNLMGVVPQDKYRALEQKYVELQKKVADQKDTITVLRKLLAERGTYQGETAKVFQDLVKKQADAFETLMKNIAAEANEANKKSS